MTLILARKVNERLLVHCTGQTPQTLRVVVTEIADGRVKLGFDGPKTIRVIREELVAKAGKINENAR